jgi:hypothetical protein
LAGPRGAPRRRTREDLGGVWMVSGEGKWK